MPLSRAMASSVSRPGPSRAMMASAARIAAFGVFSDREGLSISLSVRCLAEEKTRTQVSDARADKQSNESVSPPRYAGAAKAADEPARAAAGVAAGRRRAGGLFDGTGRIVLRGRPAAPADPPAALPALPHRRLPAPRSSPPPESRPPAPGRP